MMENYKTTVTELELAQLKELRIDTESPCNKKEIPLWLVLLDNIPTLVLFVLGTILVYHVSTTGAVIFAFYALFSI